MCTGGFEERLDVGAVVEWFEQQACAQRVVEGLDGAPVLGFDQGQDGVLVRLRWPRKIEVNIYKCI